MSLKKRGVLIVASLLIGILFFTKDVNAASLFNFSPSVTSFYETWNGWLDFIIYFMIFSTLARVTFMKVFIKDGDDKMEKIITPLYLGFGLLLSLGLALWTNQMGISFIDLGIPALIIGALALSTLGFSWLANKGKDDKDGSILKKLGGWTFFIFLLLLLLLLLFFYPQLWSWLPYGWGDEILSLLIILLTIIGLVWLIMKIGKWGKGNSEGEGFSFPWKIIGWILALILLLLLLFYGIPVIFNVIKTLLQVLFKGLWWLVALLIALAIGYLIWKALKLFWKHRGLDIGLNLSRFKFAIIFDPNRGKNPHYMQGSDNRVRITAQVTDPKGSGNYSYFWRAKKPQILIDYPTQQTCQIDINNYHVEDNKSIDCNIEIIVKDIDRNKTSKGNAKFIVSNLGRRTPPEEPPERKEDIIGEIKIHEPVNSGKEKNILAGDQVQFRCTKSDNVVGVRWTYLEGHTPEEEHIRSSVPNTFLDKEDDKVVFPVTESGEFTIFCIGIDERGQPIPGAHDHIFINVGKEGEKLTISSPVKSGRTLKLNKRMTRRFEYKREKTNPHRRGGWW